MILDAAFFKVEAEVKWFDSLGKHYASTWTIRLYNATDKRSFATLDYSLHFDQDATSLEMRTSPTIFPILKLNRIIPINMDNPVETLAEFEKLLVLV